MDIDFIIAKILPTIIAGAVCIFLVKISPSIKTQKTWTNDTKIDLQYFLIATFGFGYLYTFFTNLVFAITYKFIGKNLAEAEYITSFPLAVKILLAIVIFDLVAYWIHRFYHVTKLWRIHAIHHSTKEIDWLSAARFHPIDRMLIIAAQYFTAVIVFGLTPEIAVTGGLIRSTYGLIVHSNLNWTYGKLGYIIASPVFHRWHHTQEKEGQDKNFAGVFSLWDYTFGTAYKNSQQQPHNFGIKEDIGNNIFTQIASPFIAKKKHHKPQKTTDKQ